MTPNECSSSIPSSPFANVAAAKARQAFYGDLTEVTEKLASLAGNGNHALGGGWVDVTVLVDQLEVGLAEILAVLPGLRSKGHDLDIANARRY